MSRLRVGDLGDSTHNGLGELWTCQKKFEVILRMDWLIAYGVVIDCERRRITAYTQDGTPVVFQGGQV